MGFALVALAGALPVLADLVALAAPARVLPVHLVALAVLVAGSRSWLFMPEGHVAKRYVQGVPAEPTGGKFPCAPNAPPKG